MDINGSGEPGRGPSLNPAQRRAVEENGCQLILAGPGSGKTKVITSKILHLVRSGVKPEHILALTFTDKAAEEMGDRLEKEIDTAQLTIGTFHSFCLEVLQDNVLESGISFSSGIISRTSQLVWGLKNIDRFGFTHIELGNNGKEVIEAMIDGISAFRDELITPDDLETYLKEKESRELDEDERDLADKLKDMLKVYRAYEAYKRKETLIDFDDMIYLASQLFERKPLVRDAYRKRYTHILVDEFQDTNYAQLHLVKQLAGDNVCVVGDDDQSIYRFRGAYLTNFGDFKGHFRVREPVTLDVNYRNSKNILGLAMQLMENAPNREPRELRTGNAEGDKVIVARCENEQAEAAYVLQEIRQLAGSKFFSRAGQKEREYRYGDFAILCRRKAEGMKYYHLLRKNLIPCEFVGELDFFSSPAIRELTAYLRATENPLQAGTSLFKIMKDAGITEVNARRINHCAKRLAYDDSASDHVYECMMEIADQDTDKAADIVPNQQDEIRDIVRTLDHMIWKRDTATVSELVHAIMMSESGIYNKYLHAGPAGRTGVRLLNRFYEMCQEYESITRHATLASFLEYIDMLRNFRIESDDSTDGDSVKIMTVHQSKGKEFPVVFIADMATNKFPLRYQSKEFYVPNDLSKGIKTRDDERALYQQEERRLCYVAMTRAEQKLYFTLAERYGDNKNKTRPSRFLDELKFESNPLIEIVNVKADSKGAQGHAETEAERRMNDLKDQAVRAVYGMQLRTAMNKLTLLDKLRVLNETGSLDAYDPTTLYAPDGGGSSGSEDAELLQLLTGKPVPLIDSTHTFSASALDTYDSCPMKYKLQYVLKVPTAGKTFFNLGSAVHSVVEHLSKMHMKGERYTKDIAVKLLDTYWSSDAYTSKTKEQEDRRQAEAMIDTYLEWQRANLNTIVGVEMPFKIEINGRAVKGFIDRLERTRDGDYVVIDFKTGSKSENGNSIKENIQMNVYALAVLKKYGKLPARASLYYIKSNETVDYAPDNTWIDVQRERLEEMIQAVLEEKFAAAASYDCRWCDYEGICEAKESEI